MVELCFNQSAQGALKMAQHCGGKGRHSVGIVFCTSEDGEKPSRRAVRARLRKVRAEQDRLDRYAVPLGNKSSDVLCLGLALSLGDIALWRRTDPGGRCSGSSTPTSSWTGRRPTRTGGRFWPLRRS